VCFWQLICAAEGGFSEKHPPERKRENKVLLISRFMKFYLFVHGSNPYRSLLLAGGCDKDLGDVACCIPAVGTHNIFRQFPSSIYTLASALLFLLFYLQQLC